MSSPHIFIISWAGQHHNAILIADKLAMDGWSVNIIYSDPDPTLTLVGPWISTKRPNDLFWADKFKACLENFHSNLMLVIHADTQCDDWSLLVKKCLETMDANSSIGVWAPLIDNTPFHVDKTTIAKIAQTRLHIVCQTDGLIFCLRSSIVDRMRQVNYSKNTYGHGIDFIFIAHTYSSGMLAIVDTSLPIKHASKRGYDSTDATNNMSEFLNEHFTFPEHSQHIILWSYWNSKYAARV